MSESPNKNCEFYENYENYDNCKNSQTSQTDPMRITKPANIRKGTKNGLQDVRGTQRELRIVQKLRELRKLRKFANDLGRLKHVGGSQ